MKILTRDISFDKEDTAPLNFENHPDHFSNLGILKGFLQL